MENLLPQSKKIRKTNLARSEKKRGTRETRKLRKVQTKKIKNHQTE